MALPTWPNADDIITISDVRAAGMTVAAVRAQVRARRWRRVLPRVYCTHNGPLTRRTWLRACLRYGGRGACLSAFTAAEVHGLRAPRVKEVHMTIPEHRRVRRQPGLVLHRSSLVDDSLVQERDELRVVRVELAAVQIALAARAAAAAVISAVVQQGLTTAERLRACALYVRAPAWLLAVVDDVAGGTRSLPERLFLSIARRAGLPEPARNFPLAVAGRQLWLDLCYPTLRIAIEIDGKAYHVWSDDWERDLARQNLIVLDGWLVLRFTSRDLRERPQHVVAQVRAALAMRAAA
ncbi:MAG: DUF559 domain-containing protein [Mycobacteriales bacterium]